MADYFSIMLTIFLVNVIPAFMPPSWVVLALAMMHDSTLDPFALTLIGALSSTGGRAALALLSSMLRRFFTSELEQHAENIRIFFEKRGKELFIGTFFYSLGPFPSNLIFIANGLTKTNPRPVFAGFFFGRLLSYYALIVLSQNLFVMLNNYFKNETMIRYIFDILGIIAALSIILVDWKKLIAGLEENKR